MIITEENYQPNPGLFRPKNSRQILSRDLQANRAVIVLCILESGCLMTEKNTSEDFFDSHEPVYYDRIFAWNTIHEVDFLSKRGATHPAPLQWSNSPQFIFITLG